MTTPVPLCDLQPDGDIIEAWRDGDEAAAGVLVRRHAIPLARWLSGARAGEDIDDLVQETFFRAFRRIKTFKGASSFRTWLMTIGSNILKDAWRRRSRLPVVSLEDREIVDQASDPQGEAVAEDIATGWERASRPSPDCNAMCFCCVRSRECHMKISWARSAPRREWHAYIITMPSSG